jgi:hypothetical protein
MEKNTKDEANEKPQTPPPIFIKTIIKNFKLLTEDIKLVIKPDTKCSCISTSKNIRIKTYSLNAYRAVINYLKERKAELFTHQLREEKPYRVVIMNLHLTTSIEYIKDELEQKGFLKLK